MKLLLASLAFAAACYAAGPADVLDRELSGLEREVVPLVQAMPADKFNFVPTNGAFKTSRTFAQQATHLATVVYEVSASVLNEKCPVEKGTDENGAPALKSKEDIVKYMQDAFAYAHKAVKSISADNLMELAPSAFGNNKAPRLSMATVAVWHSYDHYGQMVIYARLNNVVPPASR